MDPLISGALIGAGIGFVLGAITGGIRYITSANQLPPSRKVSGPLRNYLSWSRRPMVALALIGAVGGALIGSLIR